MLMIRSVTNVSWPVVLTLALAPVIGGCIGGGSDNGLGSDDLRGASRTDAASLLYSATSPSGPKASAQNAAFSPNGDQIVFTVFRNGYNKGPAELWIINLDGTDAHRITPSEDQDSVNVPGAAWNAVRDEIVFASDREESDDIWTIRPDGSGLRRVTTHSEPPYWIEPVWSPDGAWIVFESDTEAATELAQRGTIYKVRSDGSDLTQLTKQAGQDFDDRLPNWSPDGDHILFQRRIPSDGEGDTWDIYVVDAGGDDTINVSGAAEYFNTDNSWSTDGRWIASSSEYPVEGDRLPIPNIIGFFFPDEEAPGEPNAPVRITSSDNREDGAPSVSPDGCWVAFESHQTEDEQSPSNLWLIATPAALQPDNHNCASP